MVERMLAVRGGPSGGWLGTGGGGRWPLRFLRGCGPGVLPGVPPRLGGLPPFPVPGTGPRTFGLRPPPWVAPVAGMRVVVGQKILKSGGGRVPEGFAGDGACQVPPDRASVGGARVVRRVFVGCRWVVCGGGGVEAHVVVGLVWGAVLSVPMRSFVGIRLAGHYRGVTGPSLLLLIRARVPCSGLTG